MNNLKKIIVICLFILTGSIWNHNNAAALSMDPDILRPPTENVGCTVTYNANGGTVSPRTEFFRFCYGEFPIPVRNGYTFLGWYYNGMKIASGSSLASNSDHIFIAQWEPNIYTVNFDANGGSCSTLNIYVVYDGTYGALPNPTRAGYEFIGWSSSKTESKFVNSSDIYTTIGNQTLYALWKEKTVKITFNTNGGKCAIPDLTVQQGAPIGILPVPYKNNYVFAGWYTNPSGGNKINDNDACTFTSDTILYAHWESNSITDNKVSNVTSPDTVDQKKNDNTHTNVSTNKQKKGKITLSWKKVNGAAGYQIKISQSKKFKKCITKTYGKNKRKASIGNLKKGKKYYVKIRAYAKSGKKKIYGKWSKTVKKKAK